MRYQKAALFITGIGQASPLLLSNGYSVTAAATAALARSRASLARTRNFGSHPSIVSMRMGTSPEPASDNAAASSSSPLLREMMTDGGAASVIAESSSTIKSTPLSSIAPLVDQAREIYLSRLTHPYEFRMSQLRGIERLLTENYDELVTAIAKDLGQGAWYADVFELANAITRVGYVQTELRGWMGTKRMPTPWPMSVNMPVHTELAPNPRGVALLISPWNLPIQLTINVLVEALAAGNVCVLKMSEKSVHVTKLLTELLTNGKYVDSRVVKVVNGEVNEATELLKQRFDVISYTGGEPVGRIVAQAAAKHLTPALLELGGKNPVFVTKSAHIPSAALRIAWGKVTANTGQMCICPDYVLVEESVKEEFVNELCKVMDELYPVSSYSNNNGERGSVGKMISVQHAERVVAMVDSTCNVIYGGKHHDAKERFVAPTVVEASADSSIMKEEVFGPVLAILTVPNLDKGIEFVNDHYTSKGKHPLALYIFSKSKEEQQKILSAVPSGGGQINDVIKQSGNYHVPFGGVGTSGMGAYNGKYGFDFFSHYRAMMVCNNRSTWKWDPLVWLANPPFDGKKLFLMQLTGKLPVIVFKLKKTVFPVAKVVLPVVFALACFFDPKILDALLELNLKTVIEWISQMIR